MKEVELCYPLPHERENVGKCVCDKPGPAEGLGKQDGKREVII